jgi:glycosyltransferase involved in cell wall biosynthesis
MVGAPSPAVADQPWYAALMSSIKALPNLEYLGAQSQEFVNELLARSHVFVNTSLHEGFANTFIQAWMREVPVVSLNVNPDDVFGRAQVGVHAGTEEELHRAVRMLLTDPAMRRQFASASRTYAFRQHSFENALLLSGLIETGRVDSRAPDSDSIAGTLVNRAPRQQD